MKTKDEADKDKCAPSGSGIGVFVDQTRETFETFETSDTNDTNETWTTLNPALDVVAEVEAVIGKWMIVDRFLNLKPATVNEGGVEREKNAKGDLYNYGSPNLKIAKIEPANLKILDLPPVEERIRDFSKLNRSDVEELNRHGFLLSQQQQRHLKAVEKKKKLFPQRYRQSEYLNHSALLLLSPGWASAERYACCGIRNKGNPSGQCKLHKFCPYCCWKERINAQLTYVPAFDNGVFHWFTGSFKGDLQMRTESVGEDSDQWLHYWDAYKSAFREWVEDKSVRGVFWVEELAVNSLLPTHVLPHVHAIIEADEVGEDELRELNFKVSKYLQSFLGPDHLEPNITVKPINSDRALLDRVGYMLKPLNVLPAYEKAWPRASFHNRHLAQQLNCQATDLILGYSMVTTDRRKINVKGNLDAKAKHFVGISRAERDNYKALLREIRAAAGEEYIEMEQETDDSPANAPICPQDVLDSNPVLSALPAKKAPRMPIPVPKKGPGEIGQEKPSPGPRQGPETITLTT